MTFTCLAILAIFLIAPGQVWSQDERARIQLDYFMYNDSIHELVATVKTKEDRSYVNVPDVAVYFYLGQIASENKLGTIVSDGHGRAALRIPGNVLDTLHKYMFVAAIQDNERFRDYSREMEITPASLAVWFAEEEEYQVEVQLTARDSSGAWIPVSGADVKVYVQRLFGELPVSVDFNFTDDEGRVGIHFPDDIPGDAEGNIEIIVKIPDHEYFGNLIHKERVSWGMPQQIETVKVKGELWSARMNAPLYLIIIVNTILLGIWGVIVYIIYNLVRIRRLGNANNVS